MILVSLGTTTQTKCLEGELTSRVCAQIFYRRRIVGAYIKSSVLAASRRDLRVCWQVNVGSSASNTNRLRISWHGRTAALPTVPVIVDMKPTIPPSVRGDADTCKYTTVRLQHYPEVKRGGGREETRCLSGCALSKHRHPTLYTLVWYIYIIVFHVDWSVWTYSVCSQRKYARLHDFML